MAKKKTSYWEPMLAKNYRTYEGKLNLPLLVQPKVDGVRGIIGRDNKIWTRRGKRIFGAPKIQKELAKCFPGIPFDGEFDHDELSQEEVSGIVRRKTKIIENSGIFYWVFDVASDSPMKYRWNRLQDLFVLRELHHVRLLPTFELHEWEDLDLYLDEFVNQGFEGAILRNFESPYVHSRTKMLLKLKRFFDCEAIVTACLEGEGKYKKHLGKFAIKAIDGSWTGNTGAGFTDEQRRVYWKIRRKLVGRQITIKCQKFTNHGKPYVPVFRRFRDE